MEDAPVAEPDPLSKIEEMIQRLSSGRTPIKSNEWRNIEYDVRQTNSLVSPYVATIKSDVYYFDEDFHDDPNQPTSLSKIEVTLAFQRESWVMRELISHGFVFYGDQITRRERTRNVGADTPMWETIRTDLEVD